MFVCVGRNPRMFSYIYIHQYTECVFVMKLSDDDHSKKCPSACANVLFLYFSVNIRICTFSLLAVWKHCVSVCVYCSILCVCVCVNASSQLKEALRCLPLTNLHIN